MPLRETEFESEFESEFEDEAELEGESEGEEFDLGGVLSGLLGEGEFEEEYEGEEEGEEFDLGGVLSGLLGEGEYEDESEEFFGSIARFVRKNAPLLKRVAQDRRSHGGHRFRRATWRRAGQQGGERARRG